MQAMGALAKSSGKVQCVHGVARGKWLEALTANTFEVHPTSHCCYRLCRMRLLHLGHGHQIRGERAARAVLCGQLVIVDTCVWTGGVSVCGL